MLGSEEWNRARHYDIIIRLNTFEFSSKTLDGVAKQNHETPPTVPE